MKAPLLLVLATMFAVVVASAHAQQEETTPGASAVDAYVESPPATTPAASAVDAYVEAVPTGSGQTNPARPSGRDGPAVADALETVVESPRYGAPTAVSPAPEAPPTNAALTTSLSESFRSALGAIGTSSDARLVGVLLLVLLTTVAAVVLSIRRGPS
jgi:hypothetical protein